MDNQLPGWNRAPRPVAGMRLIAIVASVGFLLAACSSSLESSSTAQAAPAVTVKGFMFKPSPLAVRVGQAVTWTNRDEILHTATSGAPGSPTGEFDGTMDGQGKTFSFTFDEAGTYPYFCNRHNGMRGEISVDA